jgi:hypothetical protein
VHLERHTSRIERGGRRASLITRHKSFYFDALITADGARACAGVVKVEESSDGSAIYAERPILGPGSSVGALKQRLKELGQPIYGEKAILWRRLADAEGRESARLGIKEEASRRHAAMKGGQPAFQPAMVALPAERSAEEEARRELTHYPSAPWCIHCIVGKGRELPHRRILADAVAPLDQHLLLADDCFIKTNAGVTDADEQFATTLVVVDKDTGAVALMSSPSKEATPSPRSSSRASSTVAAWPRSP